MSEAMEAAKAKLAEKREASRPATMGEAFLAMQSELPTIPKTRDGFNFKYAPYEAIAARVYPVMHRHGFVVRHFARADGESTVVTEIEHVPTGGILRSELSFDAKAKDQDRGKSLTYGKRYNLVLLLGLNIEGEPDVDDNGAKVPHGTPAKVGGDF